MAPLRARIVAGVALGLAGCLGPSPGSPGRAEPLGPSARADAPTDWGALLFPDGLSTGAPTALLAQATTSVTSSPPAASPAPPSPSTFAASEYSVTDDEVAADHPDLQSLCKAHLRCHEIPLTFTFHPSGPYRALRAIRVDEQTYSYSTLVVQLARGVAPLPVSWDVKDPDDPGCPSIVRLIGVQQARVENGVLVIVALGENTTFVEPDPKQTFDSGARGRLLRQVVIAKADGAVVHTRRFESWGGPALGDIVQPGGRFVPWEKLAWKDVRSFTIDADGTLHVSEPGG